MTHITVTDIVTDTNTDIDTDIVSDEDKIHQQIVTRCIGKETRCFL